MTISIHYPDHSAISHGIGSFTPDDPHATTQDTTTFSDDHRRFADLIETRLRAAFPLLGCGVRPHIDTFSGQPVALLVFEMRRATAPILLAYTLVGTEAYDAYQVDSLVHLAGTLLARPVDALSR